MANAVALAHDYLTQRGGAERVVAAWCASFPDAPLYTSLYSRDDTYEIFRHVDVRASWLNHVPLLRARHRLAMPLLAPTMSATRIDADVVLASSSGWAHGVRASGRLVVYCHAPARWLYQSDRYLRNGALGRGAAVSSALLNPSLRRWDTRAAHRAATYVANSTYTRSLVADVYGIDAVVVPPPVTGPAALDDVEPSIDVLVVSRLLAYKNVDLVLEVARLLPQRSFVIVGNGPLRDQLVATSPPNVRFVGSLSADDELWSYYGRSRLLLALSHEDFGLTPVEAALAGRPTVARRAGGYIDTITDETGMLVDDEHLTARTVRDALVAAFIRPWDRAALRSHGESFSVDRHVARIREISGL
jgi:glycosyltransferase involved in cell wall biosynthesis